MSIAYNQNWTCSISCQWLLLWCITKTQTMTLIITYPILGQPVASKMGKWIMAMFSSNSVLDIDKKISSLSCIIWFNRWQIKHQTSSILVLCPLKQPHQGLLCQEGYRYREGSQGTSSEWTGQCTWTATGALWYYSIRGIRGSWLHP